MASYPTDIMGATDLIGGGQGSVDAIPTADLADLDGVIAITTSGTYFYTIDENSGAAENAPYTIKPDDEGGNKRLVLQRLSESIFDAGTVAFFGQSAAPTGWTKKTDWTDLSMLLYTTGDIGSGGSDDPKNWTTALVSAAHTLTEAQLAQHNHSYVRRLSGTDVAGGVNFGDGSSDTGNAGSNNSHSHTLTQDTFTPKYQTMIAATKD